MNILAVYVGAGEIPRRNLQHGLRVGIWGFKERAKPDSFETRLSPGDVIVIASGHDGGSPRVSAADWRSHNLQTLWYAPITEAVFRSVETEWPDESSMAADDRYVWRVKFNPNTIQTIRDVPLMGGTQVSDELAECFRKSGAANGRGYILDASNLISLGAKKDFADPWRLPSDHLTKLWARFHQRVAGFSNFREPGRDFTTRETEYKRRMLSTFKDAFGEGKLKKLADLNQGEQAAKTIARCLTSNIVNFRSWNPTLGESDDVIATVLKEYLAVAAEDYKGAPTTQRIFTTSERHGLRPSWDAVSTLLWALKPTEYFPIKITHYRQLATELDYELPSKRVDAEALDKVLAFGRAFWEALQPQEAGDWVDVQSFIWCVCPTSYDEVSHAFWWVNQGQSYEQAKRDKSIWAPKKDRAGDTPFHWQNVSRVREGDVVFNYADNNLRAISLASSAPYDSDRGALPENWGTDGWRVDLAYHELAQPIPIERIGIKIRDLRIDKGPIDRNGAVNQGYLFRLTSGAARVLFDEIGEANLPKAIREIVQVPPRLSSILQRYFDQQIVFHSSSRKQRYAISRCDEQGVIIERLDANEPHSVTFAHMDRILANIELAGRVAFASIDNTAAVRNAVLQAEEIALDAEQRDVVHLPDLASRLENFLSVLERMRRDNPFYKPAMLLCTVEGIEEGDLILNEVSFDWVASKFIDKMKLLGHVVSEDQAAQPFYHLTSDLFWLHAVNDRRNVMRDGNEGASAARNKVKYAVLKDTYWTLFQDKTSRETIRRKLETLMPTITVDKALLPSLNIILYGPPGTGKTYTILDKYVKAFTDRNVTTTSEKKASVLAQSLRWWQIVAVVLLEAEHNRLSVAEIRSHQLVQAKLSQSKNNYPMQTIWIALNGHAKADCPNVKAGIGTLGPLLFWKDEQSVWSIDVQLADGEAPELREALNQLHDNAQSPTDETRFEFVTFHQSFSYEDFIEGIKPRLTDQTEEVGTGELEYTIRSGVFKEICGRAVSDPGRPYAIFIDEINRGNVASIFGELITLIDEDKRIGKLGLTARLPYSREEFGVPDNLYIIGTMNSADRSVEALDTALRRRFTFIEVAPDPKRISNRAGLDVDLQKLLTVMNDRIEQLLDRDHRIGHSYFMSINNLSDLQQVFAHQIMPLLREYFYGNPAKIGLIVGDGFLRRKKDTAFLAHGDWDVEDFEEKPVYEFTDLSQRTAEDFVAIYEKSGPRL